MTSSQIIMITLSAIFFCRSNQLSFQLVFAPTTWMIETPLARDKIYTVNIPSRRYGVDESALIPDSSRTLEY